MRLWTIIKTLADRLKKAPCQQGTNLQEQDIGMPIEDYLKIKNQFVQDSRKHSSNKHLPHNED